MNQLPVKRISHAGSGLHLEVYGDEISSLIVRVNDRFMGILDLDIVHHDDGDNEYWVDVSDITNEQIRDIMARTAAGFVNRTTGLSVNRTDEPLLMQDLLYLLSQQRVRVHGKIPHESGRIWARSTMPTKRLPHDCELTLTTILLLKILVEFSAEPDMFFARSVGLAPADDILKLAELDPTVVTQNSKVRMDVNRMERILEALVEQIAYATNSSVGYERRLTEAAATLVRNALLREGLTRDLLEENLRMTADYDFTERQYGVFIGIIYGGALMLLQHNTQKRRGRIDLADDITSVALSFLQAVPAFGNVVGPIQTATSIFFRRIRENDRDDILRNAIDDFFLDAVIYPLLKLQHLAVSALVGTISGEDSAPEGAGDQQEVPQIGYVQMEFGSLTTCEWLRISLQACGFGRPR